MPITVLFPMPNLWDEFAPHLRRACAEAGVPVDLLQGAAPETVDVILYAPSSALQDFTPFTACRLVQSLWAGVERITPNQTLTQPLCRMVDPALT